MVINNWSLLFDFIVTGPELIDVAFNSPLTVNPDKNIGLTAELIGLLKTNNGMVLNNSSNSSKLLKNISSKSVKLLKEIALSNEKRENDSNFIEIK